MFTFGHYTAIATIYLHSLTKGGRGVYQKVYNADKTWKGGRGVKTLRKYALLLFQWNQKQLHLLSLVY